MGDSSAAQLSFEPYKDQVGGHTGADGKPSALTDNNGKFYKPIQSEQRFLREQAFYEAVFHGSSSEQNLLKLHEGSACLKTLQSFLPHYYGAVEVQGKHHLVLQDVCWGYSKPCIMDVKVGFTTGYAWAEQKYIDKCREKDEATTQATLGFRICGTQVYDPVSGKVFKADRHWGKGLTRDTISSAFQRFVPEGGPLSRKEVYGALLLELQRLLAWFQQQRQFLFFASSVLFLYDGAAGPAVGAAGLDADAASNAATAAGPGAGAASPAAGAAVRLLLVDFAHVYDAQGARDDNVIAGLQSLAQHVRACLGLARKA